MGGARRQLPPRGGIMRVFRRKRVDPSTLPRAADGHGTGELICLLSRCMYGDVEVLDTHRYPEGRKSIAGPRPRDENELWREKIVKVRLVLEPDNPDDPNAIAVLTDAGILVGHVHHSSARRMAPRIDTVLRSIAAKREFKGCAIDVHCTAFASAAWNGLEDLDEDEDKHEPSLLEVTLLLDDIDLGYKISGRDLAVPW
jgi:hypothetical protein